MGYTAKTMKLFIDTANLVDIEEALRRVGVQRRPLVLSVGDGCRHGASRQDDFAFGVEPGFNPREDRRAPLLAQGETHVVWGEKGSELFSHK